MFNRKKQAEEARIADIRSKINFHYTVMDGLILHRMDVVQEVITGTIPEMVEYNRQRYYELNAEIDRHMKAVEELEKEI